jgi:antitoxin (DNA-binding transcriptional repressor) of toxin-antitoxin stability system
MKTVRITDARNNLSALIRGLKSGSSVLSLECGQQVARPEPVALETTGWDERIVHLVREGLVRPGRKSLPKAFFTSGLPQSRNGMSVLDALLEERREGR